MNFDLNEDQRAFADSARTIFADYCGDEQLRAFELSGTPCMDALWRQCIDGGLHAITVPEAAGGLGLGMTELMAVLEQQGRALAAVPLWEHQLAQTVIATFAAPALRESLLPTALAGDALLTVCLAGLQAPEVLPRVEEANGGLRLHGRVPAVPLGAQAAHALVVAERDGRQGLLLVPLHLPGVGRIEGVTQHHLAVADLHLDGVACDAAAWLGEAALRWLEPRAIACLAALQLGVSGRQIERTVEYVSERHQFERPIGSFQLVAGEMADCKIALEAMRGPLWQLVYRLDAGLGALPQGWSTRFLACQAGHRIGHMAQHVHGGVGVDVTFPIHRYLLWSRALGLALGGAEYNLARLGDWLAHNDTLGWKYDLEEDQTI
jgi:alkylation response protein AidB-like acyl-CoA dehydrogenase